MIIYQKIDLLNAYQKFIIFLVKKQNNFNYKELYKNKLIRKNLVKFIIFAQNMLEEKIKIVIK